MLIQESEKDKVGVIFHNDQAWYSAYSAISFHGLTVCLYQFISEDFRAYFVPTFNRHDCTPSEIKDVLETTLKISFKIIKHNEDTIFVCSEHDLEYLYFLERMKKNV